MSKLKIIINTDCPESIEPTSLINAHSMALLNLLEALGYAPSQLPLADLLRQQDQLKGQWLVVSPMHWQATHNDALITAYGKDLHLSKEELKQCFQVLAEFVALEGMALHEHEEALWLLSNPQGIPLHAKSIDKVLGSSLMPELSQLDNTLFWQKFITECQMLFASKLGHLAVNGVWPWGAGVLTEKKDLKVCADAYFFPFAKLCAHDVTLYTSDVPLKGYDILLLQEYNQLHEAHQKLFNQMPIQWFWNNKAYLKAPDRWWRRLWRKN